MNTTPLTSAAVARQAQQNPYGDALQEVDVGDFLQMMIAELKNQDPLNPMDNQQILEQIGQIREIVANDQLTETLKAAFLAQNLATAGSMMGQWIAQLADDGSVLVAGQVDRVSVQDGIPALHVAGKAVELNNISYIQSESEGQYLAAAVSLVGKKIRAITDETPTQPGREVTGRVDRVSIVGGRVKLHVEDHTIDLENVEEVLSEGLT